jgi:hypothetical protein
MTSQIFVWASCAFAGLAAAQWWISATRPVSDVRNSQDDFIADINKATGAHRLQGSWNAWAATSAAVAAACQAFALSVGGPP